MFEEHFIGPLRQQFRVAEDAVVFKGTESSVVHQIEVPRAVWMVSRRKSQSLLAFAQCLLRPLASRHVNARADHVFNRSPRNRFRQLYGPMDQAAGAILGHPIVLVLVGKLASPQLS